MKLSERDEYVKYRLEKSEETYEVAKLLVDNKKWNSAIKTQFNLHYIKTGKIEVRFGKLFSDLFDWRQKGDYGDFFDFTEENVLPMMEPTQELIELIKLEIRNDE